MILRYRFLQLRRAIKNEVDAPYFNYNQRRSLVNIKLKLIKDPVLDNVVVAGRAVRATCILVSMIGSNPHHCLPIYDLKSCLHQLDLPYDLKLTAFLRQYPNIFEELRYPDSEGNPVPWFKLTPEAEKLHQEQETVFQNCYVDVLQRLQKFLMLTKTRTLPLQTIDQLKWDLGLPHDYSKSFITTHPDLFSLVRLPNGCKALELLKWDRSLAVSHLEMSSGKENGNALAFPIGFARGFGLRRKCMKWLEEWQTLPYTSPYVDASHLDPRTDVSEKRIVGVYHELLHLTIEKKTERRNISNLRKPFSMPQKFTKAFGRHPGIFYISRKGARHTVVLREAYDRDQLIKKHPLAEVRHKYSSLIKKGFRRIVLRKNANDKHRQDASDSSTVKKVEIYESEEDSEHDLLSDYDSDETIDSC